MLANTGRRVLAPSPAVRYEEVDYQRRKKLLDVKFPVKNCGTSVPRSVLTIVDVEG